MATSICLLVLRLVGVELAGHESILFQCAHCSEVFDTLGDGLYEFCFRLHSSNVRGAAVVIGECAAEQLDDRPCDNGRQHPPFPPVLEHASCTPGMLCFLRLSANDLLGFSREAGNILPT